MGVNRVGGFGDLSWASIKYEEYKKLRQRQRKRKTIKITSYRIDELCIVELSACIMIACSFNFS